jgi:acyl-CoA thioesterase FadM
MSGLLRNFITFVFAFFKFGKREAKDSLSCQFFVSPFDCGLSVLKSDKYFQIVEAAQVDFLVRTKLFAKLLRGGIQFVNAAQTIRFAKPISMFSLVHVQTKIIFADEKSAYFAHTFMVRNVPCGVVLVKMKFKKNSKTLPPREVASSLPSVKSELLVSWDLMLESNDFLASGLS